MNIREELFKTANGVSIYSYKNPNLHSFHISFFVKAGSMYEAECECGISHFLEHAAIRNVNALYGGRLYELLDAYGLEFNASTYSEMIQFFIGGASENFSFGAEIIAKILSPIMLGNQEILAERKRIKAEIRESDDKNALSTFAMQKVFCGTSLAGSIVGTNAVVDKIGKRRLEEYRKRVCTTGNVFFYITGNFTDGDISALAAEIEKYEISVSCGNRNIAPVPDGFCDRSGEVFVKNADYTMVRFTFDFLMSEVSVPESDLLYDILLSGYNSRLFIEMSEKRGIFYDTSGAVERYSNIGTLYFSFEVKEKDLYEAIALVVKILTDMKTAPPSDRECMKAGYVDNALMLYDDARELNFTFAYDNHVMEQGYADIEARRAAYASVSADGIKEAAKTVFAQKNLTLCIKGKKRNVDTEKIKDIISGLQ